MTKQFWIFFAIGIVGVAIVAGIAWEASTGAHLELSGRILHVRTLALNPKATIVIVDFREANPSDVSFIVKDVEMKLEGVAGEPTGQMISKADMETVFESQKLLGPKFSPVLSLGDHIDPHQSVDRMVGARFELGEPAVEARTAVHLQFLDLDRAVAELRETK